MQVFLSILLTLALVAVLIRYLHRLQLRSSRDFAEQTAPLPPLDNPEAPQGSPGDRIVTLAPERRGNPSAALPWREEVRQLRETGKFQEAINLCRRQYPKMLAFRQTLITMRASFKQAPEVSDESLDNLYRTALLANIAKARKNDPAADDIDTLSDRLENPRQHWDRLGYKHLDMLTKNDCRLLTESWGEPTHHGDITQLM